MNETNTTPVRPVEEMTDRELMEEIVTGMRSTRTLVESFIADFANNPMMGSLMRMFGGRK